MRAHISVINGAIGKNNLESMEVHILRVGSVKSADRFMDAKRILVVDDNPASRELLRSALESRYDVEEASNGPAAIARLHDALPDLVLMDIQMPEMDGYETLRMMRAEPVMARVPVIAITAFAMFEDRQKAFSAGFDGYLPKPINITALRMQIELLLKK